MVEEAERRQWPEVVRAGLYGLLRHAAEKGGDAKDGIRRLLERASADGDDGMVALALAWRGWVAIVKRGEMGGQADEDVARAAVMLEAGRGALWCVRRGTFGWASHFGTAALGSSRTSSSQPARQ
jgi:hypothetical protein